MIMWPIHAARGIYQPSDENYAKLWLCADFTARGFYQPSTEKLQ